MEDCELFDSNGDINMDAFVEIMGEKNRTLYDEPDASISRYNSAKEALVGVGILNRESGFRVDAYGILSRNPREAVNCGNQLYFSLKSYAKMYAEALEKTGDLEPKKYTFKHVKKQ